MPRSVVRLLRAFGVVLRWSTLLTSAESPDRRRGVAAMAALGALAALVVVPGLGAASPSEGRHERGPAVASIHAIPAAPVREGLVANDTASGPFVDSNSDSGLQNDGPAELIVNSFFFLDVNPGIVTDDLIQLVSTLDTNLALPGSQADLDDSDAIAWDLDLDNNQATGSPTTGSEFSLVVFGKEAGPEQVVTNRWDGTKFVFVRSLGFRELGGDRVDLAVLRSDLEVPRGVTIGVTVVSERTGSPYRDFAPDGVGVSYPLVIDPTPTAPGVAAAATAAAVAEQTSATLSAQVNPQGLPTAYRFQYGPTTTYGSESARADAGTGRAAVAVSQVAGGLTPGTTYNYRVVATNAAGTSFGPNQTLTTAFPPPVAATGRAVPRGARSLRLTGAAETGGAAGHAYFEYGPTVKRGLRSRRVPAAGTPAPIAIDLRGLRRDRLYFYRLVVETPAGRSVGRSLSVRTGQQNQVVASIDASIAYRGRAFSVSRFRARVRIVGPTGKLLRSPRTIRRIRAHILCTRGCRVNQRFSLGRSGSATRSALGSRERIVVRRDRRGARIDLTALFGRYRFAVGSEIQIRLKGPGLRGSANLITLASSPRRLRCALRDDRPVRCEMA